MKIAIDVKGGSPITNLDWIEVKASYAEFAVAEEPTFNPFPRRRPPGPPPPQRHTLTVQVDSFVLHMKGGEVLDGEVLADVTFTEPTPKEIEG